MSVRMTRTCFPHSYAKYSAVVRAILGVIIRSIVGSFARLRNKVTLSIEPFSSKSRLKNCAVSMFTPIAAKTIAKFSSSELYNKLYCHSSLNALPDQPDGKSEQQFHCVGDQQRKTEGSSDHGQ
ncbi:Os01g0711050 [Oryza sativa Japonica Group]|uniref:Os01g0711050 protein n=1 Tax=Oryza sativa subsp. japonica TaxID=39947 RepID=A0A0P0V784_ORYSJ|nr:Os01g0711050 [Oryza sativa Japonica Group]